MGNVAGYAGEVLSAWRIALSALRHAPCSMRYALCKYEGNDMDHKTTKDKLTFVTKDQLLVSVMGIGVLVLSGFIFYEYLTPEWSAYQSEFRDLVTEKLGPERAAAVPQGLQQIYVKELGKIDRCVTCHQSVEWRGLESAPEPYRTHPKEILQKHPIAKFGCTSCHAGQGYATNMEQAHGLVEHWEEPLLGKELADFYVLSDKKALMQLNCNTCHRYDKETKGTGYINRAKQD
jgi:hypothetical protein